MILCSNKNAEHATRWMRTIETARTSKRCSKAESPNSNQPKYSMDKMGSQLPWLPNDALHPVTYENLYRNEKSTILIGRSSTALKDHYRLNKEKSA